MEPAAHAELPSFLNELCLAGTCRARVIRKLEKKGYDVFYEYMLPMPNNAISAYDIYLSARLLQVLPEKIEAIAEEIVAGKRRRVSPQLFGKILAPIANMEKKFEKSFGRNLQTNDNCNGCGSAFAGIRKYLGVE